MRPAVWLISVLAAFSVAGCAGGNPASGPPSNGPSLSTGSSSAGAFTMSSRDLASGHWPSADTCDGSDDVPDLHWTAGPSGTVSYALQLFDPDAPNGGFTHWMLANEPADFRAPMPGTGVSGKNDFGHEGYEGPCPPKGSTHRYVFTVYAVDSTLRLNVLYDHADFQKALKGHVLGQGSLTATYSR